MERDRLYRWSESDLPSTELNAELAAWRWEQYTKKKYVFDQTVSLSEKTAAERRMVERDFLLKEAVRLLSPAQLASIAKKVPGAAGPVVESPMRAVARMQKAPMYNVPPNARKGWTGSWDPKTSGVDLTPGINTFEEQHAKARQTGGPLNVLRSPQTGNRITLR